MDEDLGEDSLDSAGGVGSSTPDAAQAMPLRSPEGFMCEPAAGPVAAAGPAAAADPAAHGAALASDKKAEPKS